MNTQHEHVMQLHTHADYAYLYSYLATLCLVLVNTETQTESSYRRTSQHRQVAGTYMHSGWYMVKALKTIRSSLTCRSIPEDDSTPFQCVRSLPTLQTVGKP